MCSGDELIYPSVKGKGKLSLLNRNLPYLAGKCLGSCLSAPQELERKGMAGIPNGHYLLVNPNYGAIV